MAVEVLKQPAPVQMSAAEGQAAEVDLLSCKRLSSLLCVVPRK
jgi:hypothetical protein